MAAPRRLSPYSSRSVSPDPFADQYDPFDPPLDPYEMSNMSRPSPNDSTHGFQTASSPEAIPLRSPPQGTYYPPTRGDQYVPLAGPSATRTPTTRHDGASSTFSQGSLSRYKTMDVRAQALADRRAGEIHQWHIHWQTPALVAALYAAGILAAVGHHFFYLRLDGKPAHDQLKMIRYGTALAFLVKSTLVGTVILCYRQRIWHTFRKKAMTIHAIDGLFSATEDLSKFWNLEMIRNGKLATIMAFCSWIIPIASILSPASLTTEMRTFRDFTTCPSVASLNFEHESTYDFRHDNPYPGFSLAFYNTTDKTATTEGWFDYYDQPSKNARRLAVTSVYLRKPATYTNASLDSCDQGWNCTYTISFQGPGYKCDEVANSSNPVSADITAPFNLSSIAPEGKALYKAVVDMDDYANPQIDTKDGVPTQKPPYPDTLGVFQSEPVLWIGYAINTTMPYDASSPYAKTWKNVHEPKIFKCTAYHTNYTFEMKYEDSMQIATRKARDFVRPLVDTTITPNLGESGGFSASPADKFVRPNTDPKQYKLTAAYHAMGVLLRNFLRNDISYSDDFYITTSDISETRLLEGMTSYPVHNLMEEVQNLFEDMIITLLSEPHLVVANTQSVPCEKSRVINVYAYHREGLWIGYAIVVAVTFGFIIVGAWSIYQNGVASDTRFSRIMVTTRNPTLDRLSVGACLGGDPFPKELHKTKLRFGVLLEDEPREGPLGKVEHCCFGAAGETKEIVKHGTYAGLKKWRNDIEQEVGDVHEKEGLLGEGIDVSR